MSEFTGGLGPPVKMSDLSVLSPTGKMLDLKNNNCQTPILGRKKKKKNLEKGYLFLDWSDTLNIERKKRKEVVRMLDSMTIDHGGVKGITRVPVADPRVGTRWVECGFCRQEATGEIPRKGSALCGEHNRIRRESL